MTIDVRLLREIEETLWADDAPGPDVVAPLVARVDNCPGDPEWDDDLVADTREAMDGCWLHLLELHAVQRLRGWHRARCGNISADAYWLGRTRNVLDALLIGLESTCEDEIRQLDYPEAADILAAAEASVKDTGYCGECHWCTIYRLRDECDRVMDAAGFEGGVYYRCEVLGQSVARANREVSGYCIFCHTYANQCADAAHIAAAAA